MSSPPMPDCARTGAHEATDGPDPIAERIRTFLEANPTGAVLEDGKALFDLADLRYTLHAEHGRCTLQFWSGERNLTREVVAAEDRPGQLRLRTRRFGHAQPRLLLLTSTPARREGHRRDPARQAYLRTLQQVLIRNMPDWQPEAFRASMDLEHSFGPGYARGLQVRGREAWAVIGVGASEARSTIDGVLTPGVLWLDECRRQANGRREVKGLRLVVPKGTATLTLARLPWMNKAAAAWELFELDEASEELQQRDPDDQGNLATRLVHHPDQAAAQERFAEATRAVLALIPTADHPRVEQRLRSSTELGFLLHGLPFAHARISLAPTSFSQRVEITVGVGSHETVLTPATRGELAELLADLFARRDARAMPADRAPRQSAPGRSIGAFTGRPAHARNSLRQGDEGTTTAPGTRWQQRERALAAQADPLFRASPERWLESVLRENLAPLTRWLAPAVSPKPSSRGTFHAPDGDPDTRGNRADPPPRPESWGPVPDALHRYNGREALIPRFDPRFVYAQVPAIAGAADRGMLDLLGITEDRRLAVLELKAADDVHLALQGLDYWIRVRQHCAPRLDAAVPGANDFQRHGYFRGVELSPLPPRLFLVAPALHIHPATETVLRYFSPHVEWTLLALDERWRQAVRVVWRKSGGSGGRGTFTSERGDALRSAVH